MKKQSANLAFNLAIAVFGLMGATDLALADVSSFWYAGKVGGVFTQRCLRYSELEALNLLDPMTNEVSSNRVRYLFSQNRVAVEGIAPTKTQGFKITPCETMSGPKGVQITEILE